MRTTLTSPDPLEAPATIAEVKTQARIDHSADDDRIERILDAVTERIEDRTRVALAQREFVQTIYEPRSLCLELSRAPVRSVSAVTDDGTMLTAGDDYEVSGDQVTLGAAPDGPVEVTYTAGLEATASDVPASLREALIRAVATSYEHEYDQVTGTIVTPLPPAIQSALMPYMRVRA